MENGIFRFKLGDFNCVVINDVVGWQTNVLLVDTGLHQVLIDTGNGDATSPHGLFLERLEATGISPADIDVVVLTHADSDHIGGAVA